MESDLPKGKKGAGALVFTLALGFGDLAVLNFVLAPEYQKSQAAETVAIAPSVEIDAGVAMGPIDASAIPEASSDAAAEATSYDAAVVAMATIDAAPAVAIVVDAAVVALAPPVDAAVSIAVDAAVEVAPLLPLPSDVTVYFSSGVELSVDDQSRLSEIAALIQERPKLRLTVIGHADQRGGDAANLQLSRRRANTVKRILVANGVRAGNARIKAFGESQLMSQSDDESGWAANRRVEIVWRRVGAK